MWGKGKLSIVLLLGVSHLVSLCLWTVNFTGSQFPLPRTLSGTRMPDEAEVGYFLFLGRLGSDKIISPERRFCKNNRMLRWISNWLLFPSLFQKHKKISFSDYLLRKPGRVPGGKSHKSGRVSCIWRPYPRPINSVFSSLGLYQFIKV